MGPGSKFLEPIWTCLKRIECLSWTLPWTLVCILVLQVMCSFVAFLFGYEPIDSPSKMVPYRFSLDLPHFCHGPSSKGSSKFVCLVFFIITKVYALNWMCIQHALFPYNLMDEPGIPNILQQDKLGWCLVYF
jgi:hypothetical protein